MKRLVILVEGTCEILLMNKIVIPYIYKSGIPEGWSIEAVKIVTNRQMNKKGGNIRFNYLLNDVKRFSAQGCMLITTFLDFFRLPTDFPGYTNDGRQIGMLEKAIYQELEEDVDLLPRFIPYIQKYEFEALLFSDIKGFELLADEASQLERIRDIIDVYANPEEINGGAATAPSKRLEKIFSYDKTLHSELILEMIGINSILSKCPRFKEWIDTLIQEMRKL